MSGNKFTPGPWVHITDERDEGRSFMSFNGPNGEIIVGGCGCCMSPFGNGSGGHTYYEPSDQDRANARLIAAAPELLEAAQEVLSACDDHIQAADGDCAMCRALAALAEAIQKATGEKP